MVALFEPAVRVVLVDENDAMQSSCQIQLGVGGPSRPSTAASGKG